VLHTAIQIIASAADLPGGGSGCHDMKARQANESDKDGHCELEEHAEKLLGFEILKGRAERSIYIYGCRSGITV
jgi:hypothetical protein